jgi:hypothetical protein
MASKSKSPRQTTYVSLNDLSTLSKVSSTTDPSSGFIKLKGCPAMCASGTVKFLNTSDKGKQSVTIQIIKTDVENFEEFFDATIRPLCIKDIAAPNTKGNKRVRTPEPEIYTPSRGDDKYDVSKMLFEVQVNKNTKFIRVANDLTTSPSTFEELERGNRIQVNGFLSGSLYEEKYYFRFQSSIIMSQVSGEEKEEGEEPEPEAIVPTFFGSVLK